MALMPEKMRIALGYDDFGNNVQIISPADHITICGGNFTRVSGDAVCSKCNSPYRQHPAVQGALWLNRGCDGLVKL